MPWHLREFSDSYNLESENQQIKYLREISKFFLRCLWGLENSIGLPGDGGSGSCEHLMWAGMEARFSAEAASVTNRRAPLQPLNYFSVFLT